MKILIIMSGFFPGEKYGGPPVSVKNFCGLMRNYADCFIVTHNHDMDDNQPYENINNGWNMRDNINIMYLSDSDYNSITFEKVIMEIKPNYIYLQGLFQSCVLPCLKLARKHNIKVVLAPRGELCAGAFRKRYKKIPYLAYLRMAGMVKRVVFQSTSDEESVAIAKYLGIQEDNIYLLPNVPSIPQDLLKRNVKKVGEGKFVFISRIHWKKNLLKAIKYMESVSGNVVFDIYGPIEDEEYWLECKKVINRLPPNVKVTYRGILIHEDIFKTLCCYDSLLFPTLSENYGHVIVEALLSGCVPIISNQTPWTDLSYADGGWAISLNDDNSFIKAIKQIVNMDNDTICRKRKNIELYLKEKLKLEKLKQDYLKVFCCY